MTVSSSVRLMLPVVGLRSSMLAGGFWEGTVQVLVLTEQRASVEISWEMRARVSLAVRMLVLFLWDGGS